MTSTANAPLGLPGPRPRLRRFTFTSDEAPDLHDIVIAIIDGLQASQIEPDLFPAVLPLLRERERALKEWRNQPASRSIAATIAYITSYRFTTDPAQIRTRGATASSAVLSPTELAVAVDVAVRGDFHQLEPRHYRAIARELQRRRAADASRRGQ